MIQPKLFLSLLLLLESQRTNAAPRVCSSDGKVCEVPGGVAPIPSVVDNRAETCPASDCDGSGVLEHHLGDDDNSGMSAGCTDDQEGGTTLENGFIRCFAGNLCSDNRLIDSVTFRVQRLEGVSGSFITVRVYKDNGRNLCRRTDSVVDLYEKGPVVTKTIGVGSGINFDVTATFDTPIAFAPDETILVEVRAPSLLNSGAFFVADSNDGPQQCDPSYLQDVNCGHPKPVTVSSLGLSSVSYVISVNTSAGPSRFEGCLDNILETIKCIFRFLFDLLWPF